MDSATLPAPLPASVSALVAELSRQPFVDRLWLFGSRARGDHEPRSDVDLAIQAKDASSAEWLGLRAMVDEARTLFSVDLVRLEDAPPELRERVLAEGRLLYAK